MQMADVTISQLTAGAPAGNNIIPYSTGTNTLGVPVSAMFQNTSVIKTNTTGNLDGLQLYTNKAARKSFWFIDKALATTGPGVGPNAGDWTSLGYITPTAGLRGKEIKIFVTHHISDSVNSVTYQLQDSFTTRPLTYEGWVKVPSVSNYNYLAVQDFSLEVRRLRTTDNLELRYRAIAPSATASTDGGNVAFAIEILGGGVFFETTGGGNDLTVPAGYLGNTFYQFPLRTYTDDTHMSYAPSTRGLFMVQPGRVGINTIAPAATLDVAGDVNIDGYLTTNLARVFATRSVGNVFNNSVVPWNNVLVNKGNNYNASTGRFTAPKAGLYRVSAFFIFGPYGGSGGGQGNFNIRVNQVTYANCHVNHNDTWDNSSMDVIVSLNTGDYVDCYVEALVSYTANPFVFYGFGYNGFSVEQLP